MSLSYFSLTLDTTGPSLMILSPSYTAPETETQITLQGSEVLSKCEVYFVDAKGNRFDYTFALNGDVYDGLVEFNDVASGIGVLYAQVWDQVMNPSPLVSKAINILPGAAFITHIDDLSRTVDVDDFVRAFIISDSARMMVSDIDKRTLQAQDVSRKVEVTDA